MTEYAWQIDNTYRVTASSHILVNGLLNLKILNSNK